MRTLILLRGALGVNTAPCPAPWHLTAPCVVTVTCAAGGKPSRQTLHCRWKDGAGRQTTSTRSNLIKVWPTTSAWAPFNKVCRVMLSTTGTHALTRLLPHLLST